MRLLQVSFIIRLFLWTSRDGLLFTGYGQTGPYREAPGYDVIIEAEAGLMHM